MPTAAKKDGRSIFDSTSATVETSTRVNTRVSIAPVISAFAQNAKPKRFIRTRAPHQHKIIR